MDKIVKVILSAKRRKLLRSRPVFERHAPVSEAELFRLAKGLNFKFTLGLSKWLLLAGYGDIDNTLSIRENMFVVTPAESLEGHVLFAHDIADNRYTFSQKDGSIYCIYPDNTVVRVSDNFPSFLQELIRHDYKLSEWMSSLRVKS